MVTISRLVIEGTDKSIVEFSFDSSGVLISIVGDAGKEELMLSLPESVALYDLMTNAHQVAGH